MRATLGSRTRKTLYRAHSSLPPPGYFSTLYADIDLIQVMAFQPRLKTEPTTFTPTKFTHLLNRHQTSRAQMCALQKTCRAYALALTLYQDPTVELTYPAQSPATVSSTSTSNPPKSNAPHHDHCHQLLKHLQLLRGE
ncbi:hypothetical protein PSPO01_11430 [Paraphaeosphaeria sporulosa]